MSTRNGGAVVVLACLAVVIAGCSGGGSKMGTGDGGVTADAGGSGTDGGSSPDSGRGGVDAGTGSDGSAVTSHVHNAPGWLPDHAYAQATPKTRVNSGSGWDPSTGTWNPGQPLAAYELTSSGTCTSGSTSPTGTGSSIHDGTCTWKYLSRTDYISLTGWAFDNEPWQSGSTHTFHDYVVSDSPLRVYALMDASCTSTVAPTGTGGTGDGFGHSFTTSDGCDWDYIADVLYTSQRSHIPTMKYATTALTGVATIRLDANYKARLWNDRPYVAGQNGEASPLRVQDHDGYWGEGASWSGECYSNPMLCYHLIITTAPGESFADNMTPSDPLTGIDPSKGVTLSTTDPYQWPTQPDGFFMHDNYVDLIGLQIKSTHGSAVGSLSASYNNAETVRGCILEGGSDDMWTEHAVVTVDTSSAVVNSLILAHSSIGIAFKYPGYALYDTIVNLDGTGSVGIETGNKWVFHDTTVANTAIFGFAHAGAHNETGTAFNAQCAHNVTDAPMSDSGSAVWINGSTPTTVDVIPGTTYESPMSAAFMNVGSDFRAKAGGTLAGAGGPFGMFGLYCSIQRDGTTNCPHLGHYDFDSPDLIGTARPQSGSYDIGAWQAPSH